MQHTAIPLCILSASQIKYRTGKTTRYKGTPKNLLTPLAPCDFSPLMADFIDQFGIFDGTYLYKSLVILH